MDEWRKHYNSLNRDQRKTLLLQAQALLDAANKRFLHNWRQTLPVMIFPGVISFFAVADPATAGKVIGDLWGFFSIVLLIGILLTLYRGVRLHSRFSLLMAGSLTLAIAALLPFIFTFDVTNPWFAAIVLYNVSLAFYLTIVMSIYLVIIGVNPPREPYA